MKQQNKWLWGAAIGSFAATALVCEVDFLAAAFGFAPVGILEFAVAIGIGACIIPIVELVKLVQRKLANKKK
jgi:Ca2+-transporting ATPase